MGERWFVSYSHADARWAEWIAWNLEAAGHEVELDRWDFQGNLVERVDRALTDGRRLLMVLSPAYEGSPWTRAEWTATFARDRGAARALGIKVKAVEVGGLRGAFLHVDLVGLNEADARVRLLAAAEGHRGKPEISPGFPGRSSPRFPGALPSVWNIPAPPAGFLGRERELAAIDAAAPDRPVMLVGLGGAGKTSLARTWAWAHAGELEWGWQLRAEHPSTFEDDLLLLGERLGVKRCVPPIRDRARAREEVEARLRSGPGRGILVVDNAGDPAVLGLPQGAGTVLVTSRDRRWRARGDAVDVAVLPPDSAREYLRKNLAGAESGESDADRLAGALGYLPLALAHARATCLAEGWSLRRYRERFERQRATLLERGGAPGEVTVATTWSLSVRGLSPSARALLDLLAHFAPDDVPVERLFLGTHEGIREHLPAGLVPMWKDRDAVEDAVGELHRASLVDGDVDGVDVHRLVQLVTRDGQDPEARAAYLGAARWLVRATLPNPGMPSGWPWYRRVGAHLDALTADGDDDVVALLLGESASFWWTQAAYSAALSMNRRALATAERVWGSAHLQTATVLGNLGETLSALGEHVEARALKARALEITQRALGPDHPQTAIGLNNLALTFSALGEHREARALQERALAITERALGPEHAETANRLGNLGETLRALGEYGQARVLEERALAVSERALGPEHPDTAIRLGNLAETMRALGMPLEALPLQERALAITERALGPAHPLTANWLGNLAETLCAIGARRQARPLQERALAVSERALGADHPDTAIRLGNLAITEWALGEYDDALARMRRAVEVLVRVLGRDHPYTRHFIRERTGMEHTE